jgi:hypothetical protein
MLLVFFKLMCFYYSVLKQLLDLIRCDHALDHSLLVQAWRILKIQRRKTIVNNVKKNVAMYSSNSTILFVFEFTAER